jgi:hypothetical protein
LARAQLTHCGIEFGDALAGTAQVAQMLALPRFGGFKAGEGIAGNRFVAGGLGPQFAIQDRLAFQLCAQALNLGGRVLFVQKVAVSLLHRSIDDAVAGSG